METSKNLEVLALLKEVASLKSTKGLSERSKQNLNKMEKMLNIIDEGCKSYSDYDISINLIKAEILKEQISVEYYFENTTEEYFLLTNIIELNIAFLRKKLNADDTKTELNNYKVVFDRLLKKDNLSSEIVYLIELAFLMLNENLEEFK